MKEHASRCNASRLIDTLKISRKFYHDLLGLETILDNDGNLIEVGTPM